MRIFVSFFFCVVYGVVKMLLAKQYKKNMKLFQYGFGWNG